MKNSYENPAIPPFEGHPLEEYVIRCCHNCGNDLPEEDERKYPVTLWCEYCGIYSVYYRCEECYDKEPADVKGANADVNCWECPLCGGLFNKPERDMCEDCQTPN